MPRGVVAYAEALRAIPRPAIAMIRVMGGILVFVVVHDLLFPVHTIMMISNALSSMGLLLSGATFWFMVPVPLRREPRLNLLVNGEVLLARVARVSQRWGKGERLGFEFHDVNGKLVRGQGANHDGFPMAGAFVPIFYDPQNPENCAPAFALNYELVLPQGFAPSAGRTS